MPEDLDDFDLEPTRRGEQTVRTSGGLGGDEPAEATQGVDDEGG